MHQKYTAAAIVVAHIDTEKYFFSAVSEQFYYAQFPVSSRYIFCRIFMSSRFPTTDDFWREK